MMGRALILATVTLLIGDFTAAPAHAQSTNLEAGKSPSQIFAGTCTACHKSPRGLLRTVPAGSLPSFLRQHYTTSPEMAGLLSSYLISNGATDTRYGSQTKPDKDARSGGRPEGKAGVPVEQLDRQGHRLHTATPEPARPEAEPRQAGGPDTDDVNLQAEPERKGRNGRRLARPADEGARPAEAAGREASERGPDGRKLKRRLSKRGRRGLDQPTDETEKDTGKADTAKTGDVRTDTKKEEPATAGPAEDKPAGEAAKEEAAKPESAKPPGDSPSATAKTEPSKEEVPKEPAAQAPSLRADPASPVTSAPPVTAAPSAAAPATTPESAGATAAPSTQPGAPAMPSTAPAAQSAAVETAPPAVSTPPAAPPSGAAAGSPSPPASQ